MSPKTLKNLYLANCMLLSENKHTPDIKTLENKGLCHHQTLKFYQNKP